MTNKYRIIQINLVVCHILGMLFESHIEYENMSEHVSTITHKMSIRNLGFFEGVYDYLTI